MEEGAGVLGVNIWSFKSEFSLGRVSYGKDKAYVRIFSTLSVFLNDRLFGWRSRYDENVFGKGLMIFYKLQ